MYPKYEEDFYGWAIKSAELLRNRQFSDLDIDHLSEEIESMGRSEKKELSNFLITLLEHLLKLRCADHGAKERNKTKWESTVKRQRDNIKTSLQENPSLKSDFNNDFLARAFKNAVLGVKESYGLYEDINLDLIPQKCPYTVEQCLDEEFYPE